MGRIVGTRLRVNRDAIAGILFAAIGVAAVVIAADYDLGSAARMGPGYYPTILGAILVVLGSLIAGRSLRQTRAEAVRFALRPMVLVLLAIFAFGLLLERLGLVLATVTLVVVGSLAGWEFRLREALMLGVAMAALVTLVFVYGLNMLIKVWPF